MKGLKLAFILLCMACDPVSAAESCANQDMKFTQSTRKESALYVLEVPQGFDPARVNIKATYDSISARQKPTHNCLFTKPRDSTSHVGYGTSYDNGICKNNNTGRTTSIYGGSGYRIGKDGNTMIIDECWDSGSGCAYIEDSRGHRIAIDSDIAKSLSHVGFLIRDCATGGVEGLNLREAFPGYIILEHAVETGYVNTYNRAPDIKF